MPMFTFEKLKWQTSGFVDVSKMSASNLPEITTYMAITNIQL